MVSSAIFGAAAGTGLALVVAMTILVYRYYAVKQKEKWNWSSLDRWPDPPTVRNSIADGRLHYHHCHTAPSSHVLDCWRKPHKSYYAVQIGVNIIINSCHPIGQQSSIESASPASLFRNETLVFLERVSCTPVITI